MRDKELLKTTISNPTFSSLSKSQQDKLRGSLYHKLDVLDRLERKKISQVDAHLELGVSESAVSQLKRNKAKIRFFVQQHPGAAVKKKARQPKYDQLEVEVVQWIKKMSGLFHQLHFGVGMRMIQAYATQTATALKFKTFKADSGWYSRFCARHAILKSVLHGTAGDVNEADFIKSMGEIHRQLDSFLPEDVYNMDETGLFYK